MNTATLVTENGSFINFTVTLCVVVFMFFFFNTPEEPIHPDNSHPSAKTRKSHIMHTVHDHLMYVTAKVFTIKLQSTRI